MIFVMLDSSLIAGAGDGGQGGRGGDIACGNVAGNGNIVGWFFYSSLSQKNYSLLSSLE